MYSNSENFNTLKEHGGRTVIDSDIQLLSFLWYVFLIYIINAYR